MVTIGFKSYGACANNIHQKISYYPNYFSTVSKIAFILTDAVTLVTQSLRELFAKLKIPYNPRKYLSQSVTFPQHLRRQIQLFEIIVSQSKSNEPNHFGVLR